MSLVEVRDLRVALAATGDDVVDGISFDIDAGELLGVVGESGCGKTTVGHALLGHHRRGARITGGSVKIDGTDLLQLDERALRAQRGRVVSYIPQDPGAALNPALRVGLQLRELLDTHAPELDRGAMRARVREVLRAVELPADDEFVARFPHQLSGGQQQRVAIAMAFLLRPRLIVLDEPTTGLDVTTQARILEVIRSLCAEHDVSGLYITHDLAVVASLAGRVLVMYAGRLAELGPIDEVFRHAAHPYTRALMDAVPDIAHASELLPIEGLAPRPGSRPSGCFFHPRCPYCLPRCQVDPIETVEVARGQFVRCIRAEEQLPVRPRRQTASRGDVASATAALLAVERLAASYGRRRVLEDISFELHPGECLAAVGESGSGKTTLSRCLVGLHTNQTGTLRFRGSALAANARHRSAELRRIIQYIFQSPHGALNQRRRVGDILGQPAQFFFSASRSETNLRVAEALERVELPGTVVASYPVELSGGERQRVAIARALICEPAVLICDEITSALDVSVQAAIVELLHSLQAENALTLLFVTHNLPLVRTIADRVLVMRDGRIVESGATESVIGSPDDDYTRTLIRDTPSIVQAELP